ncbi:MAG: biotin--[acetyl-CoA-carboxylase] ligase [Thermoplasmatota archaeon]
MSMIHRFDELESTQNKARELAKEGAPDGTVVVAKTMAGGRGQHGRTWHAPEGGWYASILIRDLPDPRFLTLSLGNAVANLLEIAGAEPQLKWVNDVWVGGRKIAGILVEGESTGADVDFLVAGIGINFNGNASDFPAPLDGSSITLEDVLGVDTCIEDTEAYILDELKAAIDKARAGENLEILNRFRARDALQGKRVRVGDVEGVAERIDENGCLVIDGTPVQSGTVELL